MNILLLGATGATGKLVLKELINNDYNISIVVRNKEKIEADILNNKNIEIIESNILDMSENEVKNLIKNSDVFISCLGHNISFKGIFGEPKKLVRDSLKKICKLVEKENIKPIKFILMNTSGNINHDENEKVSFFHKVLLFIIRTLVPPHLDNEMAANYLRLDIGQKNDLIQWVVVRPDSLINEDKVSKYSLYSSPTRSALLDAGQTSRINVANFMCELIKNNSLWNTWKGKMPVIYNIN